MKYKEFPIEMTCALAGRIIAVNLWFVYAFLYK